MCNEMANKFMVEVSSYQDLDNIQNFDYGMGSQSYKAFYPDVFVDLTIEGEKHELHFQPAINIENCRVLAMVTCDSIDTVEEFEETAESYSEKYINFVEENYEDIEDEVREKINDEFCNIVRDHFINRAERAEIEILDLDCHDTLEDEPVQFPFDECPKYDDEYRRAVASVQIQERDPRNWNEFIKTRIGVCYAVGEETGYVFGYYDDDAENNILDDLGVYDRECTEDYFDRLFDRIIDKVRSESC